MSSSRTAPGRSRWLVITWLRRVSAQVVPLPGPGTKANWLFDRLVDMLGRSQLERTILSRTLDRIGRREIGRKSVGVGLAHFGTGHTWLAGTGAGSDDQ